MPISKRRKGKHTKEPQEHTTTAGKGKHAKEQPQQHITTAGTSSPSTCKEFSRRHMFALGIGIQIVSSSLSGWSPAVDKMVLFASVVSLLTVLLGLLSEKIKNIHLETNETRLHQRRWFFLLGLGLSTFISLHRAQRFGLLFHGSSYYLPHAPQLKLARRFRNIVYSRNYRNQHMSSSDLAKTLLPPTEGLLLAGIAVEQDVQTTTTTDIEFLTALGEYFKNDESLLPSALHANSVVTPFVAVDSRNGNSNNNNNDDDNNDNNNNNNNNNNNKGSDVVLMVFGGILSEFIDNGAFESMFHLNSTFEQEWKETLSKIQDRTLSHDQVFSLDALANVEKPMLELFHATSVEGKQRNSAPEFRILRYSAPFGSCDSIGTISSSSTGWLRRMSKIHTILTQEMHLNPRYTFVGYSRGALVALDVLGRGQRRLDAHPWVHDVSAVVSVGGPLFGAEGADSIDLPGHVFYDLVKPIKQFAARLDYEHEGDAGSLGHAKEILKNSYEFLKLGWELASVDQHKGKSKNSLRAEQLFSKECGEAGVPLPSLSIVTDGLKKLLVDQFDILIPVGKYYENIKRAKLMLTSMLDGIKDLSTESRLKWWHNKQNQLPKHIALFSIPATMPEAGESVEKLDQSVLYASASTSTDWWANRMFYYAAYGDTGKQCQDGQVSCDRAIFWPQMMQRCGWDMEGRETGVLAVVGSHHWGLALPYALDGVPSHLPRGALLDAIGAMFVEREHKKEKWYM